MLNAPEIVRKLLQFNFFIWFAHASHIEHEQDL